jgi:hypothetical protein
MFVCALQNHAEYSLTYPESLRNSSLSQAAKTATERIEGGSAFSQV